MTHSYQHVLTQLILKLTKIKMSLHTFLTSALDQGEWSTWYPSCFTTI